MSCHEALLDFCPTKISLPSGRESGRVPIKKRGKKRRVLLFAEIFCAVSDEEEDEEGEEEGKKNLVEARQRSLRSPPPPPSPPLSPSPPPGNSGGGRRKLSLPVLSLRPTEQKQSKAKPPLFFFPSFHPFLAYRVAKKATPSPFSLFCFQHLKERGFSTYIHELCNISSIYPCVKGRAFPS